jgi:hypothetical protein
MVFGASHSVLCLFLKYSTRLLFRVLKEEEDARVALPSPEEIVEYQDVIESNYPALAGVWCVMDGLKIKIEKSGDEATQNTNYNGWLHAHFVGCVYVFVPSGVVPAVALPQETAVGRRRFRQVACQEPLTDCCANCWVNRLKKRKNYHPHCHVCCEALRLDSPKVGCRQEKEMRSC